MADPLNPETELNPASLPPEGQKEIDALFASSGMTQEQEINSLFSGPSSNLAQASHLISIRDNPKALDPILGTKERLMSGTLPFNQQSWQDVQKNVNDYIKSTSQATLDAEKNNDWMTMSKIALGGVGKVIGAYLQSGLGITNEEAKAAQESMASRMYVGSITDPVEAGKALNYGSFFTDELASGKQIVPKDQKPAMAFGTGAMYTPKIGMNLAMAQEYLQDLQSDKNKTLGTAGLRNFAIKSGDAFLPFVSVGDIVVDENNPEDVGRRAALTTAINDVIQKDYLGSTVAGAAVGSLGQFMLAGAGATGLLGKAATIAEDTVKVPSVLSKGATYAVVGASQSFKEDPRNLSFGQRLASAISNAATLGVSEEAGNKLEDALDHAMANHMVAKALSDRIPSLTPVLEGTAKVVGTTIGESSSDFIQAIMQGQDPIEQMPQSLAASGGIGLGMTLLEGLAGRRAKISKQGNDMLADSLLKTINETKRDTNLSEEQKASQLAELRTKLGTPEAQNLFDAINVVSGLDASVAPETTKVAQEAVEKAKQNALESMLQQKIVQKEGQIGTPATFETKAPETEEEKISALNELIGVFEKGATSINLDNTPENASKIQWLEGQGRVVGELSKDGKTYSVKNVKTDAGTWLNGTPPIEFQQDLKDQFMVRAEEIGLEQDELDQMNSEFEKAGTDQEVEDVARKYLGPTDYEVALENKLAKSQDLVAEEKPAEINAQKLQAQITALEKVIAESPAEEVPALQEQLNNLKVMQAQGQLARVARGEKSVSDLVQQFESETEKEARSGKLAPELEARPDIVLPINNPESESYQKYQKLKPDPRENSKADLGNVFNLKNPPTVELLQSLGAIDEQGRNIMSPAEALVAYVTRKRTYLQSQALSGYQKYNIADEVAVATINSFLYELRQGKSNLSLSTIFNSRLSDFIRRAVPRMRAGVGLGAAVSLETPGLRVNAVDAETLAEEQGINPAVAGAINEALDQIDATEINNQIENPSNVPSQAQRQEALSVIAQNSVAPFRESLATDAEKLAFDSLVSGKSSTAQDAAKIGTTIDNINALKSAVKLKFVANLEAQYRVAQQANALPSREVAEPEGVVKAGNLTYQQIKPFEDLFKKYQADSMFDDTELENAKALLDQVRGTRSVQMLRAFESYINNVASDKISPDAITELAEAIDQNIKDGVEEGSLSQKQGQDYIDKLNKLAEPYLASQIMEEGEAKDKIAISFRSNLLTVSDKIAEDRGFTVTEEGINEQPTTEPTTKPEVKTTADRRAEASQNFAKNEEKRTPPTKRVSQETVSGQRKEMGPSVADKTTGTGRPGVERARGTPIPKSFVESRNQLGKPYNEKVLDPLGQQTLNLLSPEQKQDVAAAVTTIESSKHKAFYLANGPGTGKTRVKLAVGKYYLDKGFNVFYLTAPDAVTPDWDAGKIGGSIEKDARLMGIPIVARGGKGSNGRGLPIEKIPGSIVVSTYTSQYLEKLIPLVDEKTVVLFDEQHAGRNLHKAIQEGKGRAWSVLMDEISKKAGRVMMSSGTPFETPDQLLSLGRLGIFDTESPDALIKRLGFEKQYLRGGKKSYWTLSPGVTEGEMQDRLEAYLDGLVKNGILRTRSLKLDGVNVEFQDVPLDAAITKQLEDIKNMYGGMQNNDISALRKMVAAQKRALEEYKVDAAAKRAIQSIRRGRKPIIYVGFVSEVNSKGQAVDPTSAAVEAAILKLAPELKIARMYTGSDQTKEQALAAFNEGGFDVLIATKEMGGTGIELDDKFGDEPRDMIIMSAPVSAIQAVQLVYRVWRTDSASRPNLIFLESKAEVDQQNIDRMRAKLRLLDATTGAGFEGLKAEEAIVKPSGVTKNLEEFINNLGQGVSGEKDKARFKQALELLKGQQTISKSFLQKKMNIGFGYADWLLKQLVLSGAVNEESITTGTEFPAGSQERVALVRSEAEPTPGQVSTTEQTIQSVLGKDYSNNVITFRDSKGEARTYNVKIAPDFQHMAAAMIGTDNESDTIIINPDKLEQAKKDLSPEAFKSYLAKVMIEETIHVETFRYFRELGLDPAEEITAIGEGLSQAARLAIARLYYSNLGSDITNSSVQTEIKALANNPYWVAMEGIRQLSQLNLTGGITEQVSSANAQDIERATNRLKDLIGQEDKSILARLGVWFDSMATVIKRGLGLAPNARDRLAMRQSIEDAISNLRKTSKKFMDASSEGPGPVPAPGTSPSSPRPSNTFDSYDLRIYRMIENHLEGKTNNVLGVTVADDMFKTVGVEEWLNALDMYTRRGAITQAERTLFRDATRAMMDGQRVSLPGMANKALEIAENNEAAGKSIPVEALVATSAPAEITSTKQNYVAEPTYREYRVQIPGQLGAETTAPSEAKATANVVSRLFDNQEVVNYNGQRYTSPGALIAALRDAGYAKVAKPIPAPAANYQGLLDDIIARKRVLADKVTQLRKEQSRLDDQRSKLYYEGWEAYRREIGAESLLSEEKFGKDKISKIRKKILEEAQNAFLAQPTARSTKQIAKEFKEATSQYQEVTNELDKAQKEFDNYATENLDTVQKLQEKIGLTQPIPAPEVRESKAVKSLATKMIDALPQSAITDLVKNTWYQSTPREQQFADAKDYIASQNNEQKVIAQFLGGTIKGPLPLQGAIGFELVKSLGPKAKTDLFAKQQLVDVMLVLSKRYGTEAGQTIDLWNALNELSSNPEAMKMFIAKQIDTSVKGRLKGYKTEEEDIATGLKDASRRATDKLTTDSSTKNIIAKIAKLVDLNKRAATVAQLEAALAEYVESDQAIADGKEFLGADLAAAPEASGSDADNIRLDPNQTKALSRMIIEIIQRSENPSVTAASEDQIKALLLLTPALRDAKNQDDVRRKLDLYFDAALANALETYSAKALGDARAREGIEPPATRGEAGRRVEEAKAKAKAKAPVSIEQGVGDGSIDHALLDAAADSLQRQAERLQKEPKVKGPMEVLVARIKSYIATNTKAEGGLQPAYVPLAKPTEAEVFKDLVDQYPTVMEVFNGIRDSLKDNFSDEELIGLEPFIEEVFNNPFTESSLKRTIRSLESIGGPKTNIQGLIRASKGDLMTFENELGALLTKNTTLDAAQQKEVKDFLREKLANLIASERKQELERIKKRFEVKKERKTRKMRSALDKLIEATNLGVLNDPEVFMQMHSQLGLPMLKDSERAHLNQLIEALPLYPAGMIRNRKVSEMYQYVKLVSPQVWGELLVNYQTSNLLAGVGTIGVNAWSAFVTNELNAGILASVGAVKGLAGDKATAKAYKDGAMALNAAIFAGEKPALTAAQNIFFKGDYSSVQDALTQELGGVNIWEAIVKQAEDYRAGKPGTARPELPVNVFGEEYRIPLDSKYLSSKYGALAPFIFFGRAMAAGDAINKISSRKMYEIAEATNIAINKGLTSTEEIDREVARLLNQSPEARKRAEAKAESEAKEFNLTPEQQSLRVEEILEQGRPDEEEVKNLIEKSKKFAAQTTFTNDFEGWFGLLADGLTTISSKAWPLRLVIKFLKTGSSLANEILNFMPGISTARLLWGSGVGLSDTKYYRPPAVPGTVEHDLLLGKMTLGYILTATLLAALREAMSGEDDPHFNLHFKGPSDPAQREAFFAAGGKLRSIQIGRFRDGKPMFLSFEGLPVGLSGPLLLSAAINETVRYEKRSKAESILLGAMTGGALAMYGVMDIAALSGIRQIMSLTSPGVGQRDAMGIMTNLSKTVGNIAGGLIPGYATLRDIEQLFDGIMGAPSGRPYQENLLSSFAQSVPFASKIGKRDLDFLGGNNKTQLANTVPFLRRLTTSGVDSKAYDNGERTPEAVHDKLISLFAANRSALDWSAGPLKDFAMMDLMKEKQARGEPVSVDDFYQLKRELSSEEKYEWLQRAGPIVQQQLGSIIPDLEKMSRVEFVTIVPQIVNPIKKAILFQILSEKNQQDVLYPERQ